MTQYARFLPWLIAFGCTDSLPEAGAAVKPCPDLAECLEECSEDATVLLCLLGCADDAGPACATCVTDGLTACAQPRCPELAAAFHACLQGCPDDLTTCTTKVCVLPTLRFQACTTDDVAGGVCAPELTRCMPTTVP